LSQPLKAGGFKPTLHLLYILESQQNPIAYARPAMFGTSCKAISLNYTRCKVFSAVGAGNTTAFPDHFCFGQISAKLGKSDLCLRKFD